MASAYTEDGWSLLHLAPNRQVADLLISHGADINAPNRHKVFGPGNRPLHAAVYMDRPDVVDALIHARAEVSATDDAGWTPLHLAVANGRTGIARRLLQAGADPNARINAVKAAPGPAARRSNSSNSRTRPVRVRPRCRRMSSMNSGNSSADTERVSQAPSSAPPARIPPWSSASGGSPDPAPPEVPKDAQSTASEG